MRTYEVTITGKTPLLMHWDNIEWADAMAAWKDDPKNRKTSKAGDDRTPAWRWMGSTYHDDDFVSIPSDNLMRCMMEGGAMVPVPGGKMGKTFKAQTQSGMMVNEPYWRLSAGKGPIAMDSIRPLKDESDFALHKEAVSALGFSLFIKRAKIGASKHIRVRPRFDQWSATGTVSVWDEQITEAVLSDVLTYAGQYKGIGDWRPGGKTPGAFGMFGAEIRKLK